MKQQNFRKALNIMTVISTVALLLFIIYGIKTKLFYSKTALKIFLDRFGIWAPIIFIVFQAIQVVFPILIGGIGSLGGILIFGPIMGFIYNYIGICIGSIAAFLIAKRYGVQIIESLFSSKLRKKYMFWAENKKFAVLFAIAIFSPVAPDDFLCYLAGTTNMTLQRFITIILFGKPFGIAAYCFGLTVVLKHITSLIQ